MKNNSIGVQTWSARARLLLATFLFAIIYAMLPADPHRWFSSGRALAGPSTAPATRVPHAPPRPGEVRQMTIKELGNFTFEGKDAAIPADVKALDGMNVRLKGYMIPTDESQGITRFILVPSQFSCCFGQPPEVQHIISVQCPKGTKAPYMTDEIWVEGKLQVKETRDEGFLVSLFTLTCTSLKLAK